MEKKKAFVVLPAFNEEKVIGQVLVDLKKAFFALPKFNWQIVVVDDASIDETARIAQEKKALVLSHPINRGLGGALRTGIEYLRQQKAFLLVTMDSDGQHEAEDIQKAIKPIINKEADVVIGTRSLAKMPWDRKVITLFSSILTFLLFGVWCKDTQSGFRAFGKKALEKISIKTQRMEVSSEFFSEIKKHKLKLVEVPIKVIYTPYSRAKGQSNLNSVKVLLKLLLRLAR